MDPEQATGKPCPRCGQPIHPKRTGRPPVWCSQACRRAAYEERRAAAHGAIGLQVVDRVETIEHLLKVCVDRTIESPVGCRRVIEELTRLAQAGALQSNPKWQAVNTALIGLIHTRQGPATRRW